VTEALLTISIELMMAFFVMEPAQEKYRKDRSTP